MLSLWNLSRLLLRPQAWFCLAAVAAGGLLWGQTLRLHHLQGQLAAALPQERILGRRFWCWRLCHGAVSGGLAMGLFALCPIAYGTLAGDAVVIPYSVSVAATLMLLLLSFLAMLCFSDFSEKKTGNAT